MMGEAMRGGPPLPAVVLGAAGLIPFVTLALACLMLPETGDSLPRLALNAYGATILSFLGGVRWGLALAPGSGGDRIVVRLAIGVLPQLAGWALLLAPPRPAGIGLAAAVLILWLADLSLARSGGAPATYARLRTPLSLGAAAALLAGALG